MHILVKPDNKMPKNTNIIQRSIIKTNEIKTK